MKLPSYTRVLENTLLRFLSGTFLVVSFVTENARADTSERAGRIRAALVYNIIKFVDFDETQSPHIAICAHSDEPLYRYLEETVSGKTVRSKVVELKKFHTHNEHDNMRLCNVLFIGEHALLQEDSKSLLKANTSAVSICIVKEPSLENCVIQIFEENNKAKIAVNLPLAESRKLKLSSELLDAALVRR